MSKPPESGAFYEAYERLNQAQKQAVDTIEGPVMVIAGPGTGKTQVLTLRIANILLQTDMKPENILALTFTESGARAMRERIKQYVGAVAYKLPIYTFHGFCQRLISDYPDSFPRIIGGRPVTDLEKVGFIENILAGAEFSLLRPMGDPTYYVTPILRMISTLKQEYVKPDDLAKIIAGQDEALLAIEKIHQKGAHKGKVRGEYTKQEKVVAKNRELLAVYRQYEQMLRDTRVFDFDDMIIEGVNALKNNQDLLRDLQESFQYILADEHQDVNGSQNKILEYLSSFHDSPNLFVVGDEKQAIYRFQGASLENFLRFIDLYPTTTKIVLTENYRSGQPVLDASHSLVRTEDEILRTMRIPLRASLVKTAEVTLRSFTHQAIEDDWLVAQIKQKIAEGMEAKEIAVIVRTNREVEALAVRLQKAGVAAFASAEGDVLDHPITKAVQSLLDFVLLGTSEEAIFRVLQGSYFGLPTEDIIKISAARSYQQSLAEILRSEEKLQSLGVKEVAKAMKIMEVQQIAREKQVHEAPHRVLEYLLEASGFISHIMTYEPLESVRVIRRLYDEIEAQVMEGSVGNLREVSQMLELRRHYNLGLEAPYIATKESAVQVMTAHKSKGLEFSLVFVPHLQDNNWGGKIRRELFTVPLNRFLENDLIDQEDDEKRLLYVAMTRAKSELYLSSASSNTEGKDTLPSRLLDGIEPSLIEAIDTSLVEKDFDPTLALKTAPAVNPIDTDLLIKLVGERGFSATSLNNYLKNPWDYIYRNILRIPEVQPLHMQFGTVVHNVLEQVTSYHTTKGAWPLDTAIKNWLELELGRLPINDLEYTRLHEKALNILFPYLSHLEKAVSGPTKEELSIKVLMPTGLDYLPEVPLSGKLDRLDLSEDGTALRVVDYKTGKAKTRNYIEGKTAEADGGYKRQLVFYALLLSLNGDERYQCREGVLSFVEPTSSGVIKEEAFVITDEEIASLKNEIIEAIASMKSGEFLTDEKVIADSDYAELVERLLRR